MPKSLFLQNAVKARDNICDKQKKEIAGLYNDWANDIGEKAKFYKTKTTASSAYQEMQLKILQKQLTETSHQLSNEINNKIKSNMYLASNYVVEGNNAWLKQFGFGDSGVEAAFTHVPNQVVQNLVTGQIYEGGWNLSSAIWGDNEKTLKDIYGIVAKGRAQNMSAYEISKALEQYVRPEIKKPWNLTMPDGVRIYKKSVDYNAQRLARTLVQHSYQQSVMAVTENNPFVEDYIWNANGSRACDLCLSRNGQHYKKGDVPLDHPNGMCILEPNVDNDAMIDKLAKWVTGDDGEFPEIDEFAKDFGYVPSANNLTDIQKKWLDAAGYKNGEMPKNFTEFAHMLSFDQQSELLDAAGGNWGDAHPFQKMEKYFNENIAKAGGKQSVKGAVAKKTGVESLGTSKGKTFNYWYTKLSPEQKELAKQLKQESGLTWQKWYEKNIYKGQPQKLVKAAKAAEKADVDFAKMSTKQAIGNFSKQTERGMLDTETRSLAKMSKKELESLEHYTGSSYDEMNGYLRYIAGGMSHEQAKSLSRISEYSLDAIKKAKAGLKKASTEKELFLRRGTDLGDLAGLLPGDFRSNLQKLKSMDLDELKARMEGVTGTYAGFTSTSSLYDRGFSGNVEIIFHAPKGTQASSIMSISNFGTGEGETLLNAGTTVKITKIEKSDGHKGSSIRVFMDIIGCK